jgi:uncharacterized protein YqeY
MLQEKIQNDLRLAILNKDTAKRDLLRVVIGEFNRVGKVLTDEKVLDKIKTMKDNAILMNNQVEIQILDEYLPKLLSDEELSEVILKLTENITGMENMGQIMKVLRDKYTGQFDGGKASRMIRERLTK